MRYDEVGAMLYISSHLTFLMLAIVPPISLGAVGVILLISIRTYLTLIRYSTADT